MSRWAIYNPFRVGTRVYLTLPTGQRVGFTFAPVKHQAGTVTYYTPAFTADPGVTYHLDSAGGELTQAGDRYYDLLTGRPYNPASGAFAGPDYTLTAPDGTVYHISTEQGVEDMVRPDGVKLFFSDAGITASTGASIAFVHDSSGRLSEIIAPDGTAVYYAYDGAGNLISVRNPSTGASSRYGYATDGSHHLTLAVAPAVGANVAVHYTPAPQVVPVKADLGSVAQFVAATPAGSLAAGATDRYAFSLRPTELSSTTSGTVFLGIEVDAASGSNLKPAVPHSRA